MIGADPFTLVMAEELDEKAVAVLENLRNEVYEAQTEMMKWKTMYKKERKANSASGTPRAEITHGEAASAGGTARAGPQDTAEAKLWELWAREKREMLNELAELRTGAAVDAQRQQVLIQEMQLCSTRVTELESGQTDLKVMMLPPVIVDPLGGAGCSG